MATPAFPLRLRSTALRELVREVSAREHISQNELIEQAVAHELLLRGATLVADLHSAASRIVEMTDSEYERVVARSLTAFADGEGLGEPVAAYGFRRDESASAGPPGDSDSLGVITAFESA